uniref:Macaca fascicularis brain cDNA, clone: QtrA-18089 n=1 Tax=Macaca fascicularis TaxID=9541 RepID=I7GPL4_MACFA|nr:unnamed protein product [Macaca fascicularis]
MPKCLGGANNIKKITKKDTELTLDIIFFFFFFFKGRQLSHIYKWGCQAQQAHLFPIAAYISFLNRS